MNKIFATAAAALVVAIASASIASACGHNAYGYNTYTPKKVVTYVTPHSTYYNGY